MRVDLHCHSAFSPDATTPLAELLRLALARGIRVLALTDHNTIRGALALRALAQGSGLTVIVGEEVSTREGELIGLFLEEEIPPGLPALETAQRIKAQGGLVLLPHGFDPFKRARLRPGAREAIAPLVDLVEGLNAQVSAPCWNGRARAWARRRGLLVSAGSDAHTPEEVGRAWAEVPEGPIRTPGDLLEALAQGELQGRVQHPLLGVPRRLLARLRTRP